MDPPGRAGVRAGVAAVDAVVGALHPLVVLGVGGVVHVGVVCQELHRKILTFEMHRRDVLRVCMVVHIVRIFTINFVAIFSYVAVRGAEIPTAYRCPPSLWSRTWVRFVRRAFPVVHAVVRLVVVVVGLPGEVGLPNIAVGQPPIVAEFALMPLIRRCSPSL